MKHLKQIIDFYIFSNIHVALATFCLTKITLLEIGISENRTAWFVFFSTLLSYNMIRFFRLNTIKNWYNDWIHNNEKALYFLTGVSLLPLLYFTFYLRIKAILVLIPFIFSTLFYVIPIKNKSLRNISGLKLFLIAISWAGVTVIFPLIQNYITIRTVDWITIIQRFLFVAIITLPFDIRDLNYDDKSLKTLPQQIGIYKTKFVGILLLMSFFFLEFFKNPLQENSLIILLIIVFLAAILLIKASNKQDKYYSAFFVEAIPIVWFLLVLLLN